MKICAECKFYREVYVPAQPIFDGAFWRRHRKWTEPKTEHYCAHPLIDKVTGKDLNSGRLSCEMYRGDYGKDYCESVARFWKAR